VKLAGRKNCSLCNMCVWDASFLPRGMIASSPVGHYFFLLNAIAGKVIQNERPFLLSRSTQALVRLMRTQRAEDISVA
jgi:hypothetical protein